MDQSFSEQIDYKNCKEIPLELQNCSVYLDLFHSCSSVRGRLREYYQTGQMMRSCMPYWNDFCFCMRMKLYAEEEVQKKYQERVKRQVGMLNSAKPPQKSPEEAGIWFLKL